MSVAILILTVTKQFRSLDKFQSKSNKRCGIRVSVWRLIVTDPAFKIKLQNRLIDFSRHCSRASGYVQPAVLRNIRSQPKIISLRAA